jgi:hypothetical protein
MDRHQVVSDWILTTEDTIYLLQRWLGLLESWREFGQAEPDDFMDGCLQLKEAHLWQWASQAGGHGLKALAIAVRVEETPLEEGYAQ